MKLCMHFSIISLKFDILFPNKGNFFKLTECDKQRPRTIYADKKVTCLTTASSPAHSKLKTSFSFHLITQSC